MATPAEKPPSLEDTWKSAQIQIVAIDKELDKIQNGGQSANETARFEKVEKIMQVFRLNCVSIILLWTPSASEYKVEEALWSVHVKVTQAYRKVIGKLPGSDRVVLKRKLEKLYSSYLKTAHAFYRGLLQRICSLYSVKELKRIARMADLEDQEVDGNGTDINDEKLQKIATSMCHKILIHIGDIARYRTLARAKDRQWNNALTYYALANELIPESGYGYHQCGVIYTETGNHLEVVYHFYRALASEAPHPNAKPNLEREFRNLREGKASSGKGGSNDAMITWFVKLHAYYYKAEQFNSRKELEDEVDTRLATALKKGAESNVDTDLLKMVLINILAFQVGMNKMRTNWTDSGSLSCQFILLQNVRTIQTIIRLLQEELVEIVHRKPVEISTTSAPRGTDTGKYTSTFNRVLPLLRVYMVWLCSASADLVKYKDHLEPRFGQMCKTLANALNLLFDLASSDIASVENRVSWRFPEDEETLGMKCLNGPELPVGSQLCYDPIDRAPKPRAEDVRDANTTTDAMTSTRVLDVIACALDLASQSPFPIVHTKILDGPREQQRFVYTENGKPQVVTHAVAGPPESSAVAAPPPNASGAVPPVVQDLPKAAAAIKSPANDSDEFSEDQEFYRGSEKESRPANPAVPPPRASNFKPLVPTTSEFPLDNQIFNLLNDFLVPPETGRVGRSPEAQANASLFMESSHGMGSTTANEAPSSFAPASPNPGSATAKAFPTLPWNYFYNPAPVESGVRSASGANPGWEQTYGQSRSRPGTSSNAIPALSPEGNTSALAFRTGSGSQNRNNGQLSPMVSGHRVSASKQMRQSAFPRGEPNGHDNTTMKASGVRDVWGAGSTYSPADPWTLTAGRWDLGQHSPSIQAVPQASFSSLAFSGVNSSLPPVNSPWGVPMKTHQAAFPPATTQSPGWADSTRSPSGFGNSSASTPLARSNTGNTPGPPPGFGYRANDSMTSYGYGGHYTASQTAGAGWGAPQSETHEGNQGATDPWANGNQQKVAPPPGFAPSTGRRVGSTDLTRMAAGQKPKQQQSAIAAIREPFGPGANGRTNFNMPKR